MQQALRIDRAVHVTDVTERAANRRRVNFPRPIYIAATGLYIVTRAALLKFETSIKM